MNFYIWLRKRELQLVSETICVNILQENIGLELKSTVDIIVDSPKILPVPKPIPHRAKLTANIRSVATVLRIWTPNFSYVEKRILPYLDRKNYNPKKSLDERD